MATQFLASGKGAVDLSGADTIPGYTLFYFRDDAGSKRSDNFIIANYRDLFKLNNTQLSTNITRQTNEVLWLNFKFKTPFQRDLLIELSPYYQKVTFYYFTKDSLLHSYVVQSASSIPRRKYVTNNIFVDLPSNTINNYFLKYEFNNHFKVAGFHIRTFSEIFNKNSITIILNSILFTSILIIFFLSVIFYVLNKELRYLFYGLYTMFFGLYAASCLDIWYIIPFFNRVSDFSHSTFVYYVPFSLSTVFFSLYILSSIRDTKTNLAIIILYGFLVLKAATLLISVFDSKIIELLIIRYFSKLDVIIYASLLAVMATVFAKKNALTHLWLAFGILVMFIGQINHQLSGGDLPAIFAFMCFDILWFGIGLSISYRLTKNEKIKALNGIIALKNNYNKELEETVQQRTLQLQEKITIIDELNDILKVNNLSLSENVAHLEKVRILNKELSFEEFKAQFPDKETCLQLLTNLKWKDGFFCSECGNTESFKLIITSPFLRKCSRCSKVHSPTNNTLFHNVKFPLEKAFYILFLSTSGKKYTIEAISEILSLRSATIANFKKKIEEAQEVKKFSKNPNMTWQDLII